MAKKKKVSRKAPVKKVLKKKKQKPEYGPVEGFCVRDLDGQVLTGVDELGWGLFSPKPSHPHVFGAKEEANVKAGEVSGVVEKMAKLYKWSHSFMLDGTHSVERMWHESAVPLKAAVKNAAKAHLNEIKSAKGMHQSVMSQCRQDLKESAKIIADKKGALARFEKEVAKYK